MTTAQSVVSRACFRHRKGRSPYRECKDPGLTELSEVHIVRSPCGTHASRPELAEYQAFSLRNRPRLATKRSGCSMWGIYARSRVLVRGTFREARKRLLRLGAREDTLSRTPQTMIAGTRSRGSRSTRTSR